ncbi:formate dehydrogenase accessory sulfurtransferase FdhD [Nannocystis sp. ILAH1]|uniref:formate dehydrogenase accessory sulfurtransferase FdhD n=1 Tax=unclassified Nannocystis TaxID=2627009 RepID=UPI00226E5040|nr:formate dehydrogenase accessory sulfurtransferase FdhD [Nannocystis sp. ILAH1]MCY1067947.1 formate dehydrogenase accessory sulfurtransferase FdhD [Nannocystis sp. RBIL2]
MTSPDPRTRPVAAVLHRGGEVSARRDLLAVEDPLEIRIVTADDPEPRRLAMTMRTPGDDADLAAGFLFTEGIVRSREQIAGITCSEDHVRVDLAAGVRLPEAVPKRSFVMTSACGVCGRASLDNLRAQPPGPLTPGLPQLAATVVPGLPGALLRAQATFVATGGIHAAGLFDLRGELRLLREDVGRHNAVDKLVGALLLAGQLPATDAVLLVSARASFELVQKALMAQIPIFAAVGAPSSLAVELAVEADMTLLGFVREGRFTVYSGGIRITR